MRYALNQNKLLILNYHWVDYDKISDNLKRAVIASEDATFFHHHGINLEAIKKAYELNQERGYRAFGGSTITQQLAKNLFLTAEKSYIRKGQEAIITLMMEIIMSKERILEIYCNVIQWGDGIYGVGAASNYYFQKTANQLTKVQSARLAAMITRPKYFQKYPQSNYLQERRTTILQQMDTIQL